MAHIGRATARQVAALALAGGKTVIDAAGEAGVSRSAVTRWQHDAGFRQLVADYRGRMVDQAVGRLADLAIEAVGTLDAERQEGEKSSDRIAAARALLSSLIALRSAAELEGRITELETTLAAFIEEKAGGDRWRQARAS